MKQELKDGLKEWFGKIDERNQIINNLIKSYSKLFYEIETDDIENCISKIAINILIKNGWDFKKHRFNGNQLSVENDRLYLRKYRHHSSIRIHFLSDDLLLIFPESFAFVIQQIKEVIQEYNKKKEMFKSERNNCVYKSRCYFTYKNKVELINENIKGKFEIVSDYKGYGIKVEEDIDIILSCDIDGNTEIDYGNSQLLNYDQIYNKVLEFIDKLKNMTKESKNDYDKVTAQLQEMVKEDNFNMMMVMNEL